MADLVEASEEIAEGDRADYDARIRQAQQAERDEADEAESWESSRS